MPLLCACPAHRLRSSLCLSATGEFALAVERLKLPALFRSRAASHPASSGPASWRTPNDSFSTRTHRPAALRSTAQPSPSGQIHTVFPVQQHGNLEYLSSDRRTRHLKASSIVAEIGTKAVPYTTTLNWGINVTQTDFGRCNRSGHGLVRVRRGYLQRRRGQF